MFDIPAAAFVRAGGSALLTVAGLIAIVLARRDKGAVALGIAFSTWGLALAGNNLLQGNSEVSHWWLPTLALLQTIRLLGFVGVLLWWPTPARMHERRMVWIAIAAAGAVALLRLAEARFEPGGMAAIAARSLVPAEANATYVVIYASGRMWAGILFAIGILFPLRYLATRPEESALRRRLAWGGVLLLTAMIAGGDLRGSGWLLGLATPIEDPLEVMGIAVSVTLWLIATRHADGRPARYAAHALTLLTLLGLITDGAATTDAIEDTAVGVQRSVFAFLLVYGMLRLGFLGREIQLRAARRGTIGMAALATLFIVAQVAQEFLSAEYGLLMGGVVAGALLFAANPIQRTLENLATRTIPTLGPTSPAPAPNSARAEAAYREAVRLALRDRAFSREERLALARLADVLGLSPSRTLEIQHEIEAEVGA